MLNVWVDKNRVGGLGRVSGGYLFSYQNAEQGQDISLTMPMTLDGYVHQHDLHPIFQMNLPEGRLRESLENSFRKHVPVFDDLKLLSVVGRSQIGRLRYSDSLESIDDVPTQSVREILAYKGSEDLLRDLLSRFSGVSGVSGIQPKVLIKDESLASAPPEKLVVKGATHIVKGWEGDEFPSLAANEFFCMTAARESGLATPDFDLSENGKFFVVKRFDLSESGRYMGFEDLCVLSGYGSTDKYRGSYEAAVKRIGAFVSVEGLRAAKDSFFRSLVVSCALRNGDAHLKNFGVLYEDSASSVCLAPAYDIVTTTVYIKKDTLALTLGGTKRFPDAKRLVDFGFRHCDLSRQRAETILEEVAEGVLKTRCRLSDYLSHHDEFSVGRGMLTEWGAGVDEVCRISKERIISIPAAPAEDDGLDELTVMKRGGAPSP